MSIVIITIQNANMKILEHGRLVILKYSINCLCFSLLLFLSPWEESNIILDVTGSTVGEGHKNKFGIYREDTGSCPSSHFNSTFGI